MGLIVAAVDALIAACASDKTLDTIFTLDNKKKKETKKPSEKKRNIKIKMKDFPLTCPHF